MNIRNHFRESYTNLVSAKLRSFLAILGVLVGTASVVALVSGGQLATEHALEQFTRLGTDLIAISVSEARQENATKTSSLTFDLEHVGKMMSGEPNIKDYAAYAIDFSTLLYKGNKLRGNVVGVTQNIQDILKFEVLAGRFISDLDNDSRYAVVGSQLAAEIKTRELGTIIGRQIQVGDQFFTVVGVLEEAKPNIFFMVDVNNAIIVPVAAALNLSEYVRLNNIIIRTKKGADPKALIDHLTQRFRDLFPTKKLFPRSPQQIIDGMKQQSRTFSILLGFIGSIALVVGGIGVMNIMLVSVVERRREIGVRMAVGARRRDIQFMFLTEAITLTIFGGFLGVLLGEFAAFLIATFSHWQFHIYLLPPIIGFLVSAAVGMFFGFYPAYQAARLDPIECLRSD